MEVKAKGKKKSSDRSMLGMVWFRFRKNKLAMLGLSVMIIYLLAVLLAPLYIDYNQVISQNIMKRFQSPNAEFWFGTDQYGRDLFSRVVYGGRISLLAGCLAVLVSSIAGVTIGSFSGYFGGRTDSLIMRVLDIIMAVPATLLTMAIVAALGQGVVNMLIALCISSIPGYARGVRSSVLSIRSQEYVEAARSYGSSRRRIIFHHILPNCIGPIIVGATLSLGGIILQISNLGFLGIGITAPTPEWGTILAENRANIRYYPYLGLIPGIAIGIAVMALNFIGDGLRDAFDPRTKN